MFCISIPQIAGEKHSYENCLGSAHESVSSGGLKVSSNCSLGDKVLMTVFGSHLFRGSYTFYLTYRRIDKGTR